MDSPLLFLDVDGPINVFRGYPHSLMRTAKVRCAFTGHQSMSLLLDVRHPQLLARAATAFELVWATAWEHAANTEIAPLLGLEPLPVVDWGDDLLTGRPGPDRGRIHWKTARLAEYADGRAFWWLDDECSGEDQDWFDDHDIPGHAVDIDPATGLTQEVLDRVLSLAAESF